MDTFLNINNFIETKIWESRIPDEIITTFYGHYLFWDSTASNLGFSSYLDLKNRP